MEIKNFNFLTDDVAVVETSVYTGPEGRQGRLLGTYVMVNQDGNWLIGSARISRVPQ